MFPLEKPGRNGYTVALKALLGRIWTTMNIEPETRIPLRTVPHRPSLSQRAWVDDRVAHWLQRLFEYATQVTRHTREISHSVWGKYWWPLQRLTVYLGDGVVSTDAMIGTRRAWTLRFCAASEAQPATALVVLPAVSANDGSTSLDLAGLMATHGWNLARPGMSVDLAGIQCSVRGTLRILEKWAKRPMRRAKTMVALSSSRGVLQGEDRGEWANVHLQQAERILASVQVSTPYSQQLYLRKIAKLEKFRPFIISSLTTFLNERAHDPVAETVAYEVLCLLVDQERLEELVSRMRVRYKERTRQRAA